MDWIECEACKLDYLLLADERVEREPFKGLQLTGEFVG